MGRLWLGVVVLAVLVVLGLIVGKGMDGIHGEIAKDLETAAEQALEGLPEQAMESAQRAKARWEKYWKVSATVADHGPMDEIDGLMAQLECYNKGQQAVDFAACCTRISLLVQAVSENHQLTWWNLL